MGKFNEVLEQIRRESGNNKELGDKFEVLMVEYFKNCKQYGLEDVQIWPKQDLGIDILAHDKFGERWAIQCKCHDVDSTLQYEGNVSNLWSAAEMNGIQNNSHHCQTQHQP